MVTTGQLTLFLKAKIKAYFKCCATVMLNSNELAWHNKRTAAVSNITFNSVAPKIGRNFFAEDNSRG